MQDTKTLTTTLPEGVPAPKFQLFQTVYYHSRLGRKKGTIIAIKYACALEVLTQGFEQTGWHYDLSFVFGKTPEQAVGAPQTEPCLHEEYLHPAEED